jgi:acyl-CoA thioester hydrolase
MIQAEADVRAEFYDLDPMEVVWHGNYPRFLEQGRNALLDRIGYGYREMTATGWAFPVVDLSLRYLKPIRLGQVVRVLAMLVEWENRLVIDYQIIDKASGERLSRARSTQVAVRAESGELSFVSPPELLAGVQKLLDAGA